MTAKRVAHRVLDVMLRSHWAMEPEALRKLVSIAQRRNPTPETIAAKLGRPLDNTRAVTVRDGVATIPVTGPLFRYANLFTEVSGATSYEVLATDLTAALDDPNVHAILLAVDSPGGEANGVNELAELIFEARDQKPIWAHVSGDGMSGAYWLAAAADEVVIGELGITGSIGVVAMFVDYTEADKMAGLKTFEIVSSQSPKKRPDPNESEGRAQIQRTIDDLAEVFIGAVARYRDVSPETVLAEFGKGDVFVGERAVEAGLADRVADFEDVHAELVARVQNMGSGSLRMEGAMSDTKDKGKQPEMLAPARLTKDQIAEQCPEFVTAWRAEGLEAGRAGLVEGERARILKIQELGRAHPAIVTACITDGSTPEQAAVKILEADNTAKRRHLTLLEGDEAAIQPPAPGPDASEGSRVREPDPQLVADKARHYIAEQKKQGLTITVAEAVAHVRQTLGLPSHTTRAGEQP